jgi:hypothetical protein
MTEKTQSILHTEKVPIQTLQNKREEEKKRKKFESLRGVGLLASVTPSDNGFRFTQCGLWARDCRAIASIIASSSVLNCGRLIFSGATVGDLEIFA